MSSLESSVRNHNDYYQPLRHSLDYSSNEEIDDEDEEDSPEKEKNEKEEDRKVSTNECSKMPSVDMNMNINRTNSIGVNASNLVQCHEHLNTPDRTEVESKSTEDSRRDMYGFEIRGDLIGEYGAFIDRYMERIQEQNERFENFFSDFQIPLSQGVLPTNSHLQQSGHQGTHGSDGREILELTRKGIPPKYRGKLWQIFSGTSLVIEMSGGIYHQVLEDFNGKDSEAISQIDKDIARTFANNIGSFSRDSLRRVLVAYSWKNPNVGYCQAMNFLVAGLLVFMDEEETFWFLSFIVEKLLPHYFTENLIGPRIDAMILQRYIRKRLPKLAKHFSRLGFDISTVCTQWFMCLFITSVPNETAFTIWDYMFLVGPKVIFEVALSILKLGQKSLLEIKDETEVALFLHQFAMRLFDSEVLFSVKIKTLDHKKISQMREEIKQTILKETKRKQLENLLVILSKTTHFSFDELVAMSSQFVELNSVEDFGINISTFSVLSNLFPEWKGLQSVLYPIRISSSPDILQRNSIESESEFPVPGDFLFVSRLFQSFDENKDNLLDFRELMIGLSILCRGSLEERLNLCCKLFFTKGTNSLIDKAMVTKMLASIYHLLGSAGEIGEQSPTEHPRGTHSSTFSLPSTPTSSPRSMTTNTTHFNGNVSPLLLAGTSTKEMNLPEGNLRQRRLSLPFSFFQKTQSLEVSTDSFFERNDTSNSSNSSSNSTGSIDGNGNRNCSNRNSIPQSDWEKEVEFFTDMIFHSFDKNHDERLDIDEFKEAVLMQPLIVKCFRLERTKLPEDIIHRLSSHNNTSHIESPYAHHQQHHHHHNEQHDLTNKLIHFFKTKLKL